LHEALVPHIIEIEQLCARFAVSLTKGDPESMVLLYTDDGTYSAFGEIYELEDMPTLVRAAPQGLFLCGTPAVELDPDEGTGTGEVPLCFVDQTNHAMRLGWYTDTYLRVDGVWKLRTRKMTFLRRNGDRDSGKAHDPLRPIPRAKA